MSFLRDLPNPKRQGDIGLAAAIAWLMRNGYFVFTPLGDFPYYDLVAEKEDRLYKVQAKTSFHEAYPGIYQVQLATNGGNRSGTGKTKYFDPTKVDYVFILTDADEMYFIPSCDIASKKCINLGERYEEYRVG
jgi:hypothetical protein